MVVCGYQTTLQLLILVGVLIVDLAADNKDWNSPKELFFKHPQPTFTIKLSFPLPVVGGGLEGNLNCLQALIKEGFENNQTYIKIY